MLGAMCRWPVCLILGCLPALARAEVPPTAPGPVDRALAPVLRSGCLEGLSDPRGRSRLTGALAPLVGGLW
jgi:hypothetical protein